MESHDHRIRRCPSLGHEVPFSYCRAPASDTPCRNLFNCWWQVFDVESWAFANFAKDQLRNMFEPRQGKVASIIELIEQARGRKHDENT